VLFTLMVQGTTMQGLMKWLHMVRGSTEQQLEYERRHARAVAARASLDHLGKLHQQGLISEHTWDTILPLLTQHAIVLADAVREVASAAPDVHAGELDTAWREQLSVQRTTYAQLRTDGVLQQETFGQLISEVDVALTKGHTGWVDLIRGGDSPAIKRLAAAVIQEKDCENATHALNKLGLPTTHLPSVGQFLGRKNATLLVGLPEGEEAIAVEALRKTTSNRVTFDLSALPDLPLLLPAGTTVNIGGVTLFVFDVERYEEF